MAVDVETAARRQAKEFTERSLQRLKTHLDKVRGAGVDPVIIGGWAVTAHGSVLGSRDIDGLIPIEDQRAVGDALGNTDFVARHLEGDSLFDYDFLEATNRSRVDRPYKFAYKTILNRHLVNKTILFGAGKVTLRIPDPTALFFLKAKAFTDRSYCYVLRTTPAEFKHLEDETKKFIQSETAEYWAAKAAKDMDDLAFLSTLKIDRKRLATLLESTGLRKYATLEWTRNLPELFDVADKIRVEAGLDPGYVRGHHAAVLDLLT